MFKRILTITLVISLLFSNINLTVAIQNPYGNIEIYRGGKKIKLYILKSKVDALLNKLIFGKNDRQKIIYLKRFKHKLILISKYRRFLHNMTIQNLIKYVIFEIDSKIKYIQNNINEQNSFSCLISGTCDNYKCINLGGTIYHFGLNKCCAGLSMVKFKNKYICAKIGDGICDKKYENKYNSKDCKDVCSSDYKPVCTINPFNNIRKTYINSCVAKKHGVKILYYGKCKICPIYSIIPKSGCKIIFVNDVYGCKKPQYICDNIQSNILEDNIRKLYKKYLNRTNIDAGGMKYREKALRGKSYSEMEKIFKSSLIGICKNKDNNPDITIRNACRYYHKNWYNKEYDKEAISYIILSNTKNGENKTIFSVNDNIYGTVRGLGEKNIKACLEPVGTDHCKNSNNWGNMPDKNWKYINGEWKANISRGILGVGKYKLMWKDTLTGKSPKPYFFEILNNNDYSLFKNWNFTKIEYKSLENGVIYNVGVKWTNNKNPIGTAIWLSGGWGKDSLRRTFGVGNLQDKLFYKNIRSIELEFLDEKGYWKQPARGYKHNAFLYKNIIDILKKKGIIKGNFLRHIGLSNGATTAGFGLAYYDFDKIFDKIVLGSGPFLTNMYDSCINKYSNNYIKGTRGWDKSKGSKYRDVQLRSWLDEWNGFTRQKYCLKKIDKPGLKNLMDRYSLLGPGSKKYYNTEILVIMGGKDELGPWLIKSNENWYKKIKARKIERYVLPSEPHAVFHPNSKSFRIIEKFLLGYN